MRVLLINTSERIGGAAVATSRLMDALTNNGIKAKMLVRDKQTDKTNVVALDSSWKHLWNFLWERVVIWAANRFHRNHLFEVDIANAGTDITTLPEFRQADVIHLHWINQGMLSLKNIKKILESGKPIVWTLHDMWPLTGICHHPYECRSYQTECQNCFFLYKGGSKKDLSYSIFNKKKTLYDNISREIKFIAVSQWQQDLLNKSALLGSNTIDVIPNALLFGSFNRLDRQLSRVKLGLPTDKYILVFGAARIDDPIKGFSHLIEAIRYLDKNDIIKTDKMHLLLFGKIKNEATLLADIPISYSWYGVVADTHKLSEIYSAADIYAMPSLYETFGQTAIEAMACGCVPIAFDNSGTAGIIDHLHNGYTARFLSIEDFANGIHWILQESDYDMLSEEAVRKVNTNYSENIIARKYIDVYNKVTGTHD